MRAITTTIAGVAGLLTLAAAGAPAMAATPAPVSVVSCSSYSLPRDGAMLIPQTAPAQFNTLRITFVNQAPLTATDVRFVVQYSGHAQVIEDTGKFSSGVSISNDFTPADYIPYNGPATCSVQSVTFSDGSTWQPA
ncbi:MAG: hypothetical protein JWM87_3710 [Candidatus Eremiobacteraeota bacterium]|nr:hypothetical protein [Candidatus Eremiobacteraeota bacterium]